MNQILGEYAAFEQEVVVCLKRGQRLLKVSGSLLDILGLFDGQLVQVLIDRCGRLDAVANTVQTSHKLCRESEIGIARRVGRAEFKTLSLRIGASNRDANTGRAVTLRVHHIYGSLVARHKALVRVNSRVGKRQHSGGMLN